MKIKQLPDDFQVEERTDIQPSTGDFALYRLEKTGWTTHDALGVVRRRWKVRPERVCYGGMKDRHARTSQHITILHGPRRGLAQQRIRLTYLGQVPHAFSSSDIRANRFRIAVRAMTEQGIAAAQRELPEVQRDGLPNYFDDQRFGSVTPAGGEFVAQHLIRHDFEKALQLALTGSYEHDRADAKREKKILRDHWGDWPACKSLLPRGVARRPIEYLDSHPTDFRGAFERLSPEHSGLYLSAYQSWLWNQVLAEWIERHFGNMPKFMLRLKLQSVPAPRELTEAQRAELAGLMLPLPSARLHYEDAVPAAPAQWQDALRSVLARNGIELSQLRVPGLRRPFFSRGERAMWFRPAGLTVEVSPDECNPNRQKLLLCFELPRGSYATLVLKRVTQYPDDV